MKYIKMIPNILTFSRIGITILLGTIMISGAKSGSYVSQIVLITSLTMVLYATDFLDGRLARALKCTSKFGARLDIVSDFFYIISQAGILLYMGMMSKWILVIILMEFIVFMVTSLKAIKITGVHQVWFDRIGRVTAIFYYAMPLMYLMIAGVQDSKAHASLVLSTDLMCFLLTVAAIGSRLTVVVDTRSISREEI